MLKKNVVEKLITGKVNVVEEKATRHFIVDNFHVSVLCNKSDWRNIVVDTMKEILRRRIYNNDNNSSI